MIINCPCGEKKFKINASLIPKEGRNLQCGSCNKKWFFVPEIKDIHKDGRSGRIRTCDPLVPNQMRYQAALHSENVRYSVFTYVFNKKKKVK